MCRYLTKDRSFVNECDVGQAFTPPFWDLKPIKHPPQEQTS